MSVSRSIEDMYPLTPMQHGMLFHTLYAPASGQYVQQVSVRLRGPLDPLLFRRAWERLVDRHAVLRTGFDWERRADPFQVVYRQATLPWVTQDWSADSRDDDSRRIEELLRSDRARGFTLARPPLMRLTLTALGAEAFHLLWTHHHLILDGWSVPLLLRDLFAIYRDLLSGRDPEPDVRRPFRDHVAAVRRQDAGAAQAFWTSTLADTEAPPPLPSRFRRADAIVGPSSARAERRLTEPATAAIVAFTRTQGVTPGTVAQGAWALVLGRASHTSRPLMATTVSGRSPEIAGADRIVGLCINTLPVPVHLRWETPVAAWLQELQARLARMRAFEHTPLSDILQWARLGRGAGDDAPIETLFVFENYPVDEALADAVPGLVIEAADVKERTNFPLTLVVAPGREWLLQADFDPSRYDAALVNRLLRTLDLTLAEMVAAPGRPLGTLPGLDADERRVVLTDWNATACAWPDDSLVPALIDQQADRAPTAIAIDDGARVVSYDELRRRSDGVARALRHRGIGSGDTVGVLLPLSTDAIIALIGVLKAGAAYVPIDPALPESRQAFIAADAGVKFVISSLVDIPQQCEGPGTPDHARPGLDALAYVLYTSGSTGTPKGVMVTHGGLVNYVRWATDAYDAAHGSGAPMHSPLGFDLTVTSLFPPLVAGRTVQVVTGASSLESLASALARADAFSLVKLTPAHLEGVTHLLPAETPVAVRALVIGGEALTYEQLRDWRRRAPGAMLINEFGPTETVVGCAVYDAASDAEDRGPVPIGRPIANTRLYVLDPAGEPLPPGAIGELYIAGDGVARGYQGRPDLTAERFLPDPFAPRPGDRMYRSGDLARWSAEGVLHFLGRADDQIKLRGHRIEPGEIEAALQQHPSVDRAAVVVCAPSPGEQQLVAFVTPASAATADLRSVVRTSLPAAMVPDRVIGISDLPLTNHGKVDRRALAAAAVEAGHGRAPYVPPAGPLEELVALAWSEALGRDRIGRDESFFEIGGHSLLATRLLARLRRALDRDIPLRSIFDHPTIASFAVHVARGEDAGHLEAIEPRPPGEPPTLSFAQQRLWFLYELDRASAAYLVPVAFEVNGRFDAVAFRAALDAVVARHETLRLTIETQDGRPLPSIAASAVTPVTHVDLSTLAPEVRHEQVRELMAADMRAPFELARPPLLRATLARLDDTRHLVLITMHHLVSDAWSTQVLVNELAESYDAFASGREPMLPALSVQYADVARWQRRRFDGGQAGPILAYWRTRLAELPVLDLPADGPHPTSGSLAGSRVTVNLDDDTVAAMRRLASGEHATMFMACLAVLEILLARYCAQNDFAIGTPVAARDRAEMLPLIGLFMNTLVLRSDVEPQRTFRDLLRAVRTTAVEAQAHGDVPFDRLVDALQPERRLDRSPVFQVMFTLEHAPNTAEWPRLSLTPVPVDAATSKFELSVAVVEAADGWTATFEYRTDVFSPAMVERMARHYTTLLAEAARTADQPVSSLRMLDGDERARELATGNRTAARSPEPTCVHQVFEAQAARTPDAVAVVFDTESITYDALNRQVNRLAHQLIAEGVGTDVLVGLAIERSTELVVAILAVLKAGGAYVPLDPSYPQERTALMLEDAGCRMVLSRHDVTDRLRRSAPEDNPHAPVAPDALAYVLFTSGSTGRPKGVMIPHRALSNHMRWMQREYPLLQADRVLQKTPANFDASVWEFLAPVMAGATLVVARPGGHQDPDYLIDAITQHGVTILQVVPTLLRVLVDHPRFAACQALRRVFAGGEPLTSDLTSRFFAVSTAQLINLYGPTEATIDSVTWTCQPTDTRARVPIGLPVDETTAYVLDGCLEPVPRGVAGELYLGGTAVGRGYQRQPALTAERFVPDPFSADPGGRLYRTGDRVRRQPGGELEYLGRTDGQIKLRGFRIELGEIERALESQPSVSAAVVVLRDDGLRPRLVAYATPRATTIDPSALAAALQNRLPDYMIPSAIVALEHLPLLPSGKVDRRALPAPPEEDRDSTYLAPRTWIETTLAAHWASALGLPRVGIRDNFFALGGDSILSLQVVARARRDGLALTPAQMFLHQTIESLAPVVRRESPEPAPADAVASGPVPLTPVQHWFFELPLPERHHWNQAMLLETPAGLAASVLSRALADVVAHHSAFGLSFRPRDGGWQQHAAASGAASFEVIAIADDDALTREMERMQRALDLGTAPLFKVAWFDRGARTGRLLIVAHHLVIDGVSWRVLTEDLRAAFEARRAEQAPALLPPGASFAQWAHALARLADDEVTRGELDYWTAQTAEAGSCALPLDFDDVVDGNLERDAREMDLGLTLETTEALLRAAPAAYGVQTNELLIAATVEALCAWAGRRAIAIELEGHGRDVVPLDVSRTIGWFTTLFPVRLEVGAMSGAALGRAVAAQLRAVPRKGLGYGLLRYMSADHEARSRLAAQPRPSVSVNYLGQWSNETESASAFAPAPERPGAMRASTSPRTHILEIVAGVSGGLISVRVIYSHRLHRRDSIVAFVAELRDSILRLADGAEAADRRVWTPADFTAADLDQGDLDKLLARLRGV